MLQRRHWKQHKKLCKASTQPKAEREKRTNKRAGRQTPAPAVATNGNQALNASVDLIRCSQTLCAEGRFTESRRALTAALEQIRSGKSTSPAVWAQSWESLWGWVNYQFALVAQRKANKGGFGGLGGGFEEQDGQPLYSTELDKAIASCGTAVEGYTLAGEHAKSRDALDLSESLQQ